MSKLRDALAPVFWGYQCQEISHLDWADDVLFLTDTQEQLETLGGRACSGAQECGTGINDKTECRVFGPVRHCPDTIQIGPFSCGGLRSVCKYLGILLPPSLTGGPHQEARAG